MTDSPSPRVLVIGYGSLIRGDDAIGPMAAERLVGELNVAGVEVLPRHILTPELVEPISRAEQVIFLDASLEEPAGQLVCRDVVPGPQENLALVHQLEPPDLLAWSKQLFGRVPKCRLITVGGESFEFANEHLTPKVAAALERMMALVRELVTP